MKIKGLKIKIELDDSKIYNKKEAEIQDGMVSISFKTNQEKVTILEYCKISDYKYSKTINTYSDNKFNSYVKFKRLDNTELRVFTNLTWWDRQKLYLMMGDHIITKDGNFKWLIGGFLGFLFYLYSDSQSTKFERITNENEELKLKVLKLDISKEIKEALPSIKKDTIMVKVVNDILTHQTKLITNQKKIKK